MSFPDCPFQLGDRIRRTSYQAANRYIGKTATVVSALGPSEIWVEWDEVPEPWPQTIYGRHRTDIAKLWEKISQPNAWENDLELV